MAGIGFALRRLAEQDDLLGVVRAFTHSSLASSGPWLFTILCLAAITMMSAGVVSYETFTNFRIVIMYNFSFSLVIAAPVVGITTRWLADLIYERDVERVVGGMIGALALLLAIELPLAWWFYFHLFELPAPLGAAAMVNLFLASTLWLVAVFLSALKAYMSVTATFGVGMLVAFGATVLLVPPTSATGFVLGFSLGLALIVYALAARIFAEFPYRVLDPLGVLRGLRRYWMLAVSGLLYNLAIWADKWIMWLSDQATPLANGMRHMPIYDSAVFLAFLTIVPTMSVFVFSLETRFYEEYVRFYRDIQRQADLELIRTNHRRMVAALAAGARNLIVIQTTISALCLMLAPQIFGLLDVDPVGIGIFRAAVLGSYLHGLLLCATIVLSYFDLRLRVLILSAAFAAANAAFTLVTLELGFPFYGYGYFAAALVAFLAGTVVTVRALGQVPYLTFVVNAARS